MAVHSLPTPIHKVLFSIQKSGLRCLVMGGQACVLYGAAEFSKDLDLALFLSEENLLLFDKLVQDLKAECIAVPHYESDFLRRGHAVHFRCTAEGVVGLRVDIMSKMRGVESFETLWSRRTTFDLDGIKVEILALTDLVQAKKTQLDKDWPMIRRLLEVEYLGHRGNFTEAQVRLLLLELRSPSFLSELRQAYPSLTASLVNSRPLLLLPDEELQRAIIEEELLERSRDQEYWLPLKKELELLRREKVKS